MSLLKGGEIVSDSYRFVGDDEVLPNDATQPIIVTWERLQAEFAALRTRGGSLGVAFPVTGEPYNLESYLDAIDLIALEFAAFTDGRGYSLARIFRSQLGFTGEIRATGDVLADQVAFLRQVGFDAFEISPNHQPLDTWQRTATSVSLTYQQGFVARQGFAPAEIFEQRRQQRS